MHAKRQKGGFRGTQGTPLDPPLDNKLSDYALCMDHNKRDDSVPHNNIEGK